MIARLKKSVDEIWRNPVFRRNTPFLFHPRWKKIYRISMLFLIVTVLIFFSLVPQYEVEQYGGLIILLLSGAMFLSAWFLPAIRIGHDFQSHRFEMLYMTRLTGQEIGLGYAAGAFTQTMMLSPLMVVVFAYLFISEMGSSYSFLQLSDLLILLMMAAWLVVSIWFYALYSTSIAMRFKSFIFRIIVRMFGFVVIETVQAIFAFLNLYEYTNSQMAGFCALLVNKLALVFLFWPYFKESVSIDFLTRRDIDRSTQRQMGINSVYSYSVVKRWTYILFSLAILLAFFEIFAFYLRLDLPNSSPINPLYNFLLFTFPVATCALWLPFVRRSLEKQLHPLSCQILLGKRPSLMAETGCLIMPVVIPSFLYITISFFGLIFLLRYLYEHSYVFSTYSILNILYLTITLVILVSVINALAFVMSRGKGALTFIGNLLLITILICLLFVISHFLIHSIFNNPSDFRWRYSFSYKGQKYYFANLYFEFLFLFWSFALLWLSLGFGLIANILYRQRQEDTRQARNNAALEVN